MTGTFGSLHDPQEAVPSAKLKAWWLVPIILAGGTLWAVILIQGVAVTSCA